jgi:hypothetical protein
MSSLFETRRKQALKTFFFRFIMNLSPVYSGTGGKISFISGDWKEVHVSLPLNWRTRNYVGTIFGGSLYAAADPILMLQFIQILGKEYIVWDKSASIRFRKPANQALRMQFLVQDKIIETIIKEVSEKGYYEFTETLNWLNKDGVIYATVDKTLYFADKAYYNKKKIEKNVKI